MFFGAATSPADPGWDEDPARRDRGPVSPEDQDVRLDRLCELDYSFCVSEEYWDPEACAPPPG